MNLINISGNTFYIRGGTNTGLYLFNDNSALIIDPGLSGARPNKIIKMLDERNIELKYIIILMSIMIILELVVSLKSIIKMYRYYLQKKLNYI